MVRAGFCKYTRKFFLYTYTRYIVLLLSLFNFTIKFKCVSTLNTISQVYRVKHDACNVPTL